MGALVGGLQCLVAWRGGDASPARHQIYTPPTLTHPGLPTIPHPFLRLSLCSFHGTLLLYYALLECKLLCKFQIVNSFNIHLDHCVVLCISINMCFLFIYLSVCLYKFILNVLLYCHSVSVYMSFVYPGANPRKPLHLTGGAKK